MQGEYVVKPAVSAGSVDTDRFRAGEHDELAVAHAAAILASGRTVMVQPYLHEVDSAGETALLYIGGEFSHAIRKGPMLTPAGGPIADLYKAEEIDSRGSRRRPSSPWASGCWTRSTAWRRSAARACSTRASTWCPVTTASRR